MGASDNVSIVTGSCTKATQRLGPNITRGQVCEDVMYEKRWQGKIRHGTPGLRVSLQ